MRACWALPVWATDTIQYFFIQGNEEKIAIAHEALAFDPLEKGPPSISSTGEQSSDGKPNYFPFPGRREN